MGDYWSADGSARTELGRLVARAKDESEAGAVTELAERFGRWARGVALPATALVTAVAPDPRRSEHLAASLAVAVAGALDLSYAPELVVRLNSTSRMRDTPLEQRPTLTVAAGYEVDASVVAGCPVILVDDVVLTGTTIFHIGGLLITAGASQVVGLTAARTRRDL